MLTFVHSRRRHQYQMEDSHIPLRRFLLPLPGSSMAVHCSHIGSRNDGSAHCCAIVAAAEMLIEPRIVFFFPPMSESAGDVMHDGPSIDPGVTFSPTLFRIGPRTVGVSGLHEASCLIEQMLIVMRTIEEELILFRLT